MQFRSVFLDAYFPPHLSGLELLVLFRFNHLSQNAGIFLGKCMDVSGGRNKKRESKREKRESDGKRRYLGCVNGNLHRP